MAATFRPLFRLVLVLVLTLAAGGTACRREVAREGLTVLLEAPPDSLDDRLALSANGQRLAQLVVPGLVTFNDASEPVPDLAESFRWVDEKTLELTLRPRLRFHDGTELTSRDAAATLRALLEKALPSPRADRLEPIEWIEEVDARVLRLHLRRPHAPMLAELSIGIVPEERAADAVRQGSQPIGAGAFRFVEQPDEEHLTLAPFEGYWAGPPEVRALHFRVVRDETTRVLELLKGRADLVVNAVSPAVLPMLRREERLRVLTRPGTGYAYLGFNLRRGPLADVRVRQAICHLLEVAPLVEHKFHGLAVPATGMLPVTHWAYQPTTGCVHDPAKAAALLDEAGYPDPDGPGGRPRLTLSYKTSTDRFRKAIALVLKAQLEAGGIAVDLRALEFGTFFADARRGNFELLTLKWGSVVEPDLMRWVYDSSQIPTPQNEFGGLNRGAYANPRVDALLRRAATKADREQRRALYAQVQEVLATELPYAPLWHESSVAVVSDRLEGFEPSAHGFFRPLVKAREVGR